MPCTLLPYAREDGVCDRCGRVLGPRRKRWCTKRCNQLWAREHRWTQARSAAKHRDGFACRTCGAREALEVNHIVPRNGAGYGFGCWNHLANLETLCRGCHRKVTNEQARLRRELVSQGGAAAA